LALSDLQRAIDLAPENADNYYWLSNVHEKQKAYELAAEDIAVATRLDPVDQHIRDQQETIVTRLVYQGYELSQARKSAEALEKYTAALRLSPDKSDIYQRRARALIDLNRYDPATEDVKRAIQLNPDDYDAYQLLDWLLAQRRDWDQIIQYWSQYIARHSDDGRAYVERGGARYRKGDLRGAVADAKSSADLGNPQGEEAYRRLAPRLR
jgi:tetratricopeptide (TPR) repeat protein